MPGSTLGQYPLSLSFDYFPRQAQNEQYTNFSSSLYSPLDTDEFGTDFTTDSPPSPGSPISATIRGLYSLPQSADWLAWDKLEHSTGPDYLKMEAFDDAILSSMSDRNVSLSPAVNPMDLANPPNDGVVFGREGINDSQPLFQTQFPSDSGTAAFDGQSQQPALPSPSKPGQPSQPAHQRYPRGTLKRKSSSDEGNEQVSQRSSASPPPAARRSFKDSEVPATGPKKTAHNMIEKRYRNNLNDKIAALRDSVPALRVMVHRQEGQGDNGSEGDEAEEDGFGMPPCKAEEGSEDLGGLAPAHKLNKATILGKATEYIVHLERRNQNLAKENAALRGRVEGFEMLVMSRGGAEGGMWT